MFVCLFTHTDWLLRSSHKTKWSESPRVSSSQEGKQDCFGPFDRRQWVWRKHYCPVSSCTSWQLCTFTISIDVSEMDQVHVFKAHCCSSFCFQDWHRLAAWKMCVLEFSDCNIWRWLAGGKARWQDWNILQHRNVWIVCSEITLWYFVNIGIYGGYYRLLQRILCSSILHFWVNFVWTDHRMQDG